MDTYTGEAATAEFSQHIRSLKANHDGWCALMVEWHSKETPPWLAADGESKILSPIATFTMDEKRTPVLLMLPEGTLLLFMENPHYSTYVLLVEFFDDLLRKLNLPAGAAVFKPYDLSLEWSPFFTECSKLNAAIEVPTTISNPNLIAEFEKTLAQSLAENDDRHLKKQEIRLLFVEDDLATRQLLKHLTGAGDITITCAENGHEAIKAYAAAPPHIIFLDINLPDITGLALLDILYRNDPMVYPIMLTSHSSQDQVTFALKRRVKGYIIKPFNKQNILNCIERYRKETHHG